MFCPFCGTDNATDQRYCRNCGASLPTNSARPSTKSHSTVGQGSNRPSGPFVPPQPPNLPNRKNTSQNIAEAARNIPDRTGNPADPYLTNVAHAIPEGLEDRSGEYSSNKDEVIDSFFETQASFAIEPPKPKPRPSINNRPTTQGEIRTIEMGSLSTPTPGAEEDLMSTSLAMSVIKPGTPMQPVEEDMKSTSLSMSVIKPGTPMLPEEEDLKSTSMSMSVVKMPTAPIPPAPPSPQQPVQKMPIPPAPIHKSPVTPIQSAQSSTQQAAEDSFPTVMTAQAPSSREEQLRMLKEMMEAGEGPFSPPPPPPPPTSQTPPAKPPAAEQTLTMAAVRPKPDQQPKNKTDEFAALDSLPMPAPAAIDNSVPKPSASRPFEQTLQAGSLNKVPSFNQTLPATSAPTPEDIAKYGGKKKAEDIPGPVITETLNMRAVSLPPTPAAPAESFSYPNMENSASSSSNTPSPDSFDDFSSDTMAITPPPPKPPEPKPATAAQQQVNNSWPTDSTNPWGTPAPGAVDLSADPGKTEALSNPIVGKRQSDDDPFKTMAVSFAPPKGKSEIPSDALRTTPSIPTYPDLLNKNVEEEEDIFERTQQVKRPFENKTMANQPAETAASPQVSPQTNQQINPYPVTAAQVAEIAETPTAPILESTGEFLQPPVVNKPASRVPMIAAIAIILLVLGGGSFAVYKIYKSLQPTPIKVVTPPSPKPVTTPAPPPKPVVPANMVLVPAGDYVIGCDEGVPGCNNGDKYSSPAHQVKLGAFYIDIYEVTNQEYEKFIKATKRAKPEGWQDSFPGKSDEPVVNVSWEDAKAYAEWAGKRLPTEDEWEAAASGKDHLLYPWGNDAGNKRANTNEYRANNVLPVGTITDGKSPYGAFDMSGNVWEWTATSPEPYPNSTESLGIEQPQKYRVIRGGSYQEKIKFCTSVFRGFEVLEKKTQTLGFRCAKDAPEGGK